MGTAYGGIKMDERSLMILCAALLSAVIGGFFAHKAKKTEKFSFLVISIAFAVICFVGIILAAISMFTSK